jgi:hypothetical protein
MDEETNAGRIKVTCKGHRITGSRNIPLPVDIISPYPEAIHCQGIRCRKHFSWIFEK